MFQWKANKQQKIKTTNPTPPKSNPTNKQQETPPQDKKPPQPQNKELATSLHFQILLCTINNYLHLCSAAHQQLTAFITVLHRCVTWCLCPILQMKRPNLHFKSSDNPLLPWQPSYCLPTLCIVNTHICLLFTALKTSPWQINQCLVLSAQVTVNKADGAVPYNTSSLTSEFVSSSFLTGLLHD